MSHPEKYKRWYDAIIQNRRLNTLASNVYSEEHHIVPRSMGGDDSANNLVRLSAREHFICHWLLTKMTGGDDRVSMLRAFWAMRANKTGQRYVNAKAYSALKTEYALLQGEAFSGDKNPMYGKTHTDEVRKRISDGNKGDKNGMKTDAAREAMRLLKTGKKRDTFSAECIENMSKAKRGEKNNMFGKNHHEGTKKLMSADASDRSWVHKDLVEKRVKVAELQAHIDVGWTEGRVYKPRSKRGPYKKKQTA